MIGLSKKEIKILSLHDVIRLKQVDHVKNEKNILKVVPRSIYIHISISLYTSFSSCPLHPYISIYPYIFIYLPLIIPASVRGDFVDCD